MFGRSGIFLSSNLPDFLRNCPILLRSNERRSARSPLKYALASGIVLVLGCPVWAETDALMRMVGFALTGNDNADLKIIGDRANCVFAIKNDVFHLNNVYTDRIEFQALQLHAGNPRSWMTIPLRGNGTVYEHTVEPPKDDGSKLMRELRTENPDIFQPHHYTYSEYQLHLTTDNQNAVKRAWQYIYSHGCSGKQSPS